MKEGKERKRKIFYQNKSKNLQKHTKKLKGKSLKHILVSLYRAI